MNLLIILISAILINNYVLAQFLGMCPFFGVSKNTETALGMGIAVTFVVTLAGALTYLFDYYILIPYDLLYLRTVVFILIIASIVQFLEVFMKKNFTGLYAMLGVYLPMIATNCIIFGVVLINIRSGFNFIEVLANSFGAGASFTLAIVILAGIREKYENNPDIHRLFKGFPLALFSAGLMSIAFIGFQGLI